ncbi:MAG: EscE/YscE/SsaE family type III secretion system needle protein co-chaperone [Allorhizobium sp.]
MGPAGHGPAARTSADGQEVEGDRAQMTDLADALAGADGQAVAAKLIARLATAQARLGAEMERGAVPARFATISAVRRGLDHAGQVLRAAAAAHASPEAGSPRDGHR